MSETEVHHGFRSLGRGGSAGIAITLLIHGALVLLVYQSQRKTAPRPDAIRDLIITKSVKFTKPREKFWLPRIVQPPEPTRPEPVLKLNENPLVTPPPEPPPPPPPKEAPKPEDKISKDMQRALRRAQALANAAKEEDEGSTAGTALGQDSENLQGDEYATLVQNAIKQNWNVPGALLSDAQLSGLVTEVVVRVDADGSLKAPQLRQSSGNDLFDDAGLAAVRATRQVPPPPPAYRTLFRKGLLITFDGKNAPR